MVSKAILLRDLKELKGTKAEVYIPGGESADEAVERCTHLAIGAHQDDLEIMAYHGIAACYGEDDRHFVGITVTDGGGSPRDGEYADKTDAEMQEIRVIEQRNAANTGKYSAQVQFRYPSSEVKAGNPDITADILTILRKKQNRKLFTCMPPLTNTTHTLPFWHGQSKRSARCPSRTDRKKSMAVKCGGD